MKLPKISIVTPSYNQGRFIERTIKSVISQNYVDLEYVIIDGGSEDNSLDIIKSYSGYLSYWVSEKDRGQSHAINKGFDRCSGDILTWLNSDDYLLPGALQAVADAYQKNPDAGGWVGGCLRVTEGQSDEWVVKGDMLDRKQLGEAWSSHYFGQPSCFFSAEAWNKCGPLDESLHYSMDLDLWLKMLACYQFVHIPYVISCAPRHSHAKTVADRAESFAQSWIVRIRHGFEQAVEAELTQMVRDHDYYFGKVEKVRRSLVYRTWNRLRSLWRRMC